MEAANHQGDTITWVSCSGVTGSHTVTSGQTSFVTPCALKNSVNYAYYITQYKKL